MFGKGKKYRTSYLNVRAQLALQDYFRTRHDNEPYVFVTERKEYRQMTVHGMRKALMTVIQRTETGLSVPVTPHVFRHTTATMALRAGMSVPEISKLLGHEKLETTMVYAKAAQEDVQRNHVRYVV